MVDRGLPSIWRSRSDRLRLDDHLRPYWYRGLEIWPSGFCAWNNRFPERMVVNAETELVIEGYPAAGNSFAREAVVASRPGVAVASHLHSRAHVKRALEFGVPVLILLRPALESVESFMLRFPELHADPRSELRRYIRFYRYALAHHQRLGLSRFGDTTTSLGDVLACMNHQFTLDLPLFRHRDPLAVKQVWDALDTWSERFFGAEAATRRPLPSPEREATKPASGLIDRAAHRSDLARCDVLHDALAFVAQQRITAWRDGTT
jgi:hypothetical protein